MKKNVINSLLKLRLEYGYSYQKMSELTGISKTFYWQIEHKERRLSYELAKKIAKVFNKKPDEIFYNEIT